MSFDALGAGALDYSPCRYGTSRLLFRGPQRRLDAPYVAFLGGTDTYGKFIRSPFPALVERDLGVNCINFGIPNAGVDVLAQDGFLSEAAGDAMVTVLQIVGAQNLSNRFYAVHPRRNDRFVAASALLKSIYPEVDFAEFNFTRHLLGRLYKISPERFARVRQELQEAWLARMRLILRRLEGNVVLVWFADHMPAADDAEFPDPSLIRDPLFVTRPMLEQLAANARATVEVMVSEQSVGAGTEGMVFSELETLAARELLGPAAHEELAARIAKALKPLV
jgi:hypothetical protein